MACHVIEGQGGLNGQLSHLLQAWRQIPYLSTFTGNVLISDRNGAMYSGTDGGQDDIEVANSWFFSKFN